MNQHLQIILNIIQQSPHLSDEEKAALAKAARDASEEFFITESTLEQTEKIKQATAILLEKTNEQLEQKRKAVELQNRELEIEASLERVRAIAMNMMQPEDLLNICGALFQELQLLEFTDLRNVIIHTYFDDQNYFIDYDYSGFTKGHISHIPYLGNLILEKFIEEIRKGKDAFTEIVITGNDLKQWQSFRDANNELPDARLSTAQALYYYIYSVGEASIGISTFSAVAKDKRDILKRFRNVFDLAYKRYVDITNAAAQATEARIQLALERVRARTMAMQHSYELPEAATLLFQQMQTLGMPAWSAGYCTWDDDRKAVTLWMSSEGVLQPPFKAPTTEDELFIQMREGAEKGKALHIVEMGGEKLVAHYKYMRTLPVVSEILDSIIEAGHPLPAFQIMHYAYFSKGCLLFITYEPDPEAHDIFKRFGKVFDQTYTRFLDLQKAEAQAREAQIEAALEKVRSRSLAMHKSDELNDIVMVLFEKLRDLQIPVTAVGITIYIEGSKDMNMYVCGDIGNGLTINNYLLPYFDHPITNDLYHVREKGLDFFVGNYSKEEKDSFYKYVFSLPGMENLPGDVKNMIMRSPSYSIAMAPAKHSMINLNGFEGKPLSKNETDVLKRFSKIFEQAYVRFLDLQKAEAQVRETQIEASLERVRAKTIAMHKSTDLLDVITLLSEQFQLLGFKIHSANFNTSYREKDWNLWLYNPGSPVYPEQIHVPYFDHPFFNRTLEGIAKGSELNSFVFTKEEKDGFLDHLYTNTIARNAPEERKKFSYAAPGFGWSTVYLKNTALTIANYDAEPYTGEQNAILRRFGNVFEQSYTRFLDLQKAEAQAREAQIELGLERVRARAMAMQNSDELNELIGTVFTELTKLDFVLTRCVIMIYDLRTNDARWWMANSETPEQPMNFLVKYHNLPPNIAYFKAWRERTLKFEYILQDAIKKEWDDFLFTETELSLLPDFVIAGMRAPDRVYLNASFNNFGNLTLASLEPLSNEHFDILLRFAKVFDLTYTRFNDLKQAEAQAREAQIQLALERVRARTMAMQKSEELSETVSIIFKQLIDLGIKAEQMRTCAIVTLKPHEPVGECWITNPQGQSIAQSFMVPYDQNSAYKPIYDAWKKGEQFFVVHLAGEALANHLKYLQKYAGIPTAQFKALPDQPKETYTHAIFFSEGYLLIISNEPLSEYQEIFKRFGAVFQQTYTRFLDLKKAEAQAREARIETALERVRAVAMAMKQSGELTTVCEVMFRELTALGISNIRNAQVGIENNERQSYFFYVYSDFEKINGGEAGYNSSPIVQRLYKELGKSEDAFYDREFSKAEMDEWRSWRKSLSPLNDPREETATSMCFYIYSIGEGHIGISTFNAITNDQLEIVKRFRNVFELSYRRFDDLQKAEAQAREAQIEAALEKVRGRSLAMHKSEELKEVIQVVYDQFVHLDINVEHTGFIMDYKERNDMHIWLADRHAVPFQVTIPYFNCSHWNSFNEAKRKGKDFFANHLSFEEKNKFYQDLFTLFPVPEDAKDYYFSCAGLAISTVLLDNVGLYIENFSGTPYTDEENKILMRFGKVFQQTYTRFLDLQKAEGQSRESQIQLALERVRARTMAMQHSDELKNAAVVLFQQAKELGIPAFSCGYNIWEDYEKTFTSWMSAQDGSDLNGVFNIPLTDDANFIRYVESKQKGEDFFVLELLGERMQEHYRYLKTIPAFKVGFDYAENARIPLPEKQIHYLANFSHGNLLFITLEPCPEFHDVFKRFADVFDQTYTRFLDLQKAEAQAREAQIEVALERVRAKAMAMHKSDELTNVVSAVFEKLQELGVGHDGGVTLNILTEGTRDIYIWVAAPDLVEKVFCMYIPYFSHRILKDPWDALDNGLDFFTTRYTFEEKNTFYEHLFTNTGFKNFPDEIKKIIYSAPCMVQSVGLAKHSSIAMYSYADRMFSNYENDLLRRFSKVFEQSYTRFLDLQIAEAQSRESQIQLALERVRARTMAMQKSDELSDAVYVLFQQFKELGENPDQATIGLINENENVIEYWVTMYGQPIKKVFKFSMDEPNVTNKIYNAWKENKNSLVIDLQGNKLYDFAHYRESMGGAKYNPGEQRRVINVAFFSKGLLNVQSNEERSKESIKLLERFASVFEQTYTRFLDLQKAEAQSRENQIQLALERVRARTMAMQHSDELAETVYVMHEQFQALGEKPERMAIEIVNEKEHVFEIWATQHGGSQLNLLLKASLDEPHVMKKMYEAWKTQTKSITIDLQGIELQEYFQFLKDAGLPVKREIFGTRRIQNVATFSKGILTIITPEHRPLETITLLERFADVFNGTYTRFLDLQKAEAQTKESQIQLSLERVRARTMAMHKSDELKEAGELLWNELGKLDIQSISSGYVLISQDKKIGWIYAPNPATGKIAEPLGCLHTETKEMLAVLSGWKKQEPLSVIEMDEQETIAHQTFIAEQALNLDGTIRKWITAEQLIALSPKRLFLHNFNFKEGYLMIVGGNRLTAAQIELMLRFTKVFQQTYTRFLDLQKAEEQARESQIELSLERVRAKTMAMHNSNDVAETVATLFDEVVKLGIETIRCGIGIMHASEHMEVWTAKPNADGKADLIVGRLDMTMHPLLSGAYSSWKHKNEFYTYELSDDDLIAYFTVINNHPAYPVKYDISSLPKRIIHSEFYFIEGTLFVFSLDILSAETKKIFKRFANVFGQTYRRYLDLQKAEALAREAKIEAALERVRGKAMGMQNSNDVSVAASMVFTELRKLGINPIRCGVGLLNKESRKAQLYSATSSENGDSLALMGWVMLSGHPVLKKIYDSWLSNEEYYPELSGKQLKSYYELLLSGLSVPVPEWQSGQKQYGHFLPFSVGCLYAWSDVVYNESEIKILKRFAFIIDLTFRRYIELQQSEANTKEAVKQAALDRIRADIASMRTISDLDRITPLIWNELTILSVPFIRCGVFIMDELQQLIHTFLSTPDGNAIAAFHIPYTTPGNIKHVISHWHDNKNYIDHWDETAFTEFAGILITQGALVSSQQYLKTIPRGGFYLHFLPFLQGMLYVGNTNQLSEDEINLIQSIADAFSTAYARYEDFNKLEAAKQRVDKTLVVLKQTQQQLIQSEKMASLGELTAGIAHEIQNPLNFVNNFSEVSKELLEEMRTALENGDKEEAEEIANDIIQNLEKINHHGKRADAIVKGMLQHSRTTTGTKELTDINALCDEYLRLSYHGLRAKDKNFNADFKTHFDDSIGKINIVTQDIGRVLLNLYNNAFYATNEKSKSADEKYKPVVLIQTKKINDKIEIKVSDNGKGIPQNIVDKIFQPFFTTKPTGEGTGLGLSLSYDIIKAHNGEIKVETKEGEGSEFIISLLINNA